MRTPNYKAILFFAASLLCSMVSTAQQPALIIQRIFPNPSGNESPKEFVELVATRAIDFSSEPFTVIFLDAKDASGWNAGGIYSYCFAITTGTAVAGDRLYVGGSSLSSYVTTGPTCKIMRTINTGTTAGDGFGDADTDNGGVLGNGGSHADGIGVFNSLPSAVTASSVPVDAVFFGAAIGTAANKFPVPVSDLYSGGNFGAGSSTYLAPDPANDEYLYVSNAAVFYTNSFSWGMGRVFGKNTTNPNCSNNINILLQTGNALTFTYSGSLTTSYLNPPYISGVISDPADPARTLGVTTDVNEGGIPVPATDFTVTASSSNSAVVANAGIGITKTDGHATFKITPSGVGYTTITLTLTKSTSTKTLLLYYAASAAAAVPVNARFHTGISDASDAIPLDDDYFITGDDELNVINVYSRLQSGLPFVSYNYGSNLSLPDGAAVEVDVEASAPSAVTTGRVYWIGSMSNGKSPDFADKPNRNRIFATNMSGTGASTVFSFSGYYGTLRQKLISWGDANGYNFSASAAAGQDSKAIDGFAVEGMCFGPDGTTLYIAFRAPLVPTANRTKALIAPIANFESWFNNGAPSGNPVIGTPIELDLGGRGFRDLVKLPNNMYIIIAGNPAGSPITSAIYQWSGNAADAPVPVTSQDAVGLNLEAVMGVNQSGSLSPLKLQVISDNGSEVFYNDAVEAKDLAQNNFKKFRSDMVAISSSWKYIFNGNGNWTVPSNWKDKIVPPETLPGTQEIWIDPITNGECLLNVNQHISTGARITVKPGGHLRVPGVLVMD